MEVGLTRSTQKSTPVKSIKLVNREVFSIQLFVVFHCSFRFSAFRSVPIFIMFFVLKRTIRLERPTGLI